MIDLRVADVRTAEGRAVDVLVTGERIHAVVEAGSSLGVDAARIVEGRGLHILPGIIDPHTHLNFPFDEDPREGLRTETVAAAAGGITTVGNYPLGIRSSLVEHLTESEAAIAEAANVDVAIAYPLLDDKQLEEVDTLFRRGVMSYKILRAYRPPDVYEFGGVDDSLLYRAMLKVAEMNEAGRSALLKLHCENVEIFRVYKETMQPRYPDLGRDAPLTDVTWAHCRPAIVETESVVSALHLAEVTGCPIMIVHLSAGASLDPIRRAKAAGVRVFIETTPLYLETDAYRTGSPNGPHWTRVQPSVKFQEDAEALWAGVADGTVDLVGTDHAASRKAVYEGKSVWDHGASGRSVLGVALPVMLDAAHRGRLDLVRLRQLMCEVPSQVLGIADRKGRIEVGYDADLVLCDLEETREVTAESLHSRADHSCFEGRTLTGWPVTTVLRGEVIWQDGRLAASGRGRYVAGVGGSW